MGSGSYGLRGKQTDVSSQKTEGNMPRLLLAVTRPSPLRTNHDAPSHASTTAPTLPRLRVAVVPPGMINPSAGRGLRAGG